jgi:hypothetical protein
MRIADRWCRHLAHERGARVSSDILVDIAVQ